MAPLGQYVGNFEPFFTWVHLSDIHMGHGDAEHGWNQRIVLAALQEDIRDAPTRDVPPISAILVTGDLAFSGNVRSGDEYQEVALWLREIAQSLLVDPSKIFVIPGNHDVQRNIEEEDGNVASMLRSLRSGEKGIDNALSDDAEKALLTKRLQNYLDFANEFAPANSESVPEARELFWTRRIDAHEELRIRLAGFNTALLCAKEADEYGDLGKLQLGQEQIHKAFIQTRVVREQEVVIALSHHPLDWLRDKGRVGPAIRRHAHIHLCGHVHEAQSDRMRSGAGADFIQVVSGAAHGESALADAADRHGYSIGSLGIRSDGRVTLRVWPRIWSQNHDFRVDRDSIPSVDESGRPYHEHYVEHELRLHLSRYRRHTNVAPQRNDNLRTTDDVTLAQGRQRIAMLPLDRVPEPTTLPVGSIMPLSHNRFFLGREEELRALATKLKAGAVVDLGPVVIAAATGLGGIGKTQLVSEFVHRYGRYFQGGVFWLSFADPEGIPVEIARCGGAGRLELHPHFDRLPLEDQVQLVRSAWQRALPRLLVFDNCEDEESLAQWRPSTGGCRVLVTSRRERWDRTIGAETLRLDVLGRDESVALLREHRTDLPESDTDLDAIAEELGDLPLALDLAGRYLGRYHFVITPAQYLEELQRPDLLEHRSLQEGGLSPTEHEQNVARTFALSYERLDAGDPADALAVALLARAAYLAPGESIPHDLLLETLELPGDDLETRLLAEDALGRLTDLGMLQEQEQGAQRMHRLVTAFVRGVVGGEEAQRAVEKAVLDAVAPLTIEGNPLSFLSLLPHLRFITNAAERREDHQTARLCDQLGKCLHIIGAYGEATPLFERAFSLNKQVLGEGHPDTVMSLNNLALVLGVQGDFAGAQQLFEQAVSINERVWGEDHPNTALSLNNLAVMLLQQGDYERALSVHARALTIREKVLGEGHPDTAQSLLNLANLLVQARGDYGAARRLFERSLAINQRIYGEDHPDTALSLNGLALVLSDIGDYAAARRLFQRSLTIREKVLGEGHPDTAQSLYNLAVVLVRNQGDYEDVRRLLERALAIYQGAFGADHPRTRGVKGLLNSLES